VTLDEFITNQGAGPRNAYVQEKGFVHLYVRFAYRCLDGQAMTTLDLANIEAEKPGSGAFTSLVARLRSIYPGLPLFVESVLNPRFHGKLLQLGFKQVPGMTPPCYLMS